MVSRTLSDNSDVLRGDFISYQPEMSKGDFLSFGFGIWISETSAVDRYVDLLAVPAWQTIHALRDTSIRFQSGLSLIDCVLEFFRKGIFYIGVPDHQRLAHGPGVLTAYK